MNHDSLYLSCHVSSNSNVFPIVSARWCEVFWWNLTWTGFCVTLSTLMSLSGSESTSHFTPFRNQSDNSNTLLHFSASHLVSLSSASPFHPPFVSIPCLLALLHMPLTWFAKNSKAGGGGWYHLILLLWETREDPVPVFLSGAYFWFWAGCQVLAPECPQQLRFYPQGRLDKAASEVSICRGSLCQSHREVRIKLHSSRAQNTVRTMV